VNAPAPVLVAGAGPVGLAAALALHRQGVPVRVIDARPRAAHGADARAVALSHGSRLILERLGLWERVRATPVRHIEVSQAGGFGRTRIEAADHRIDALGHVARLGDLARVLLEAAEAAGVPIAFDSVLDDISPATSGALAIVAGAEVDCAALVRAEGTPKGDRASVKDYDQHAIVSEVWCDRGHDFRAHERFTTEGPLALLPLETGFSLVWCMRPLHAAAVAALAERDFLERLQHVTAFAPYLWTRAAARHLYPLSLVRRGADPHKRVVSLGNAAQSLHPVAGQGLNLGLRDAFELSLALRDGVNEGALARWHRARRIDRDAMVATTDRYVGLFSNDIAPLRAARGLGLALVDVVPPLRALVARRMMFGVR
jgi:2-octaprenyl-6-methoxyphenol hydroxylase